MTQDQYLKAKEMYINENISLRKISNELNINRKLLSRKLKEDNILIRDKNKNSISKAKRFNSFDTNIFKKIDNEEKAYWLGFLYADGYINENKGIELTLKKDDLCHIEKFKKFMKCDNKISFRMKQQAYRISIYSKKLAFDLIKLGCFQNKSLILEFPTEQQVPRHLIHHFMRGYFDGDGCITSGQGQLRLSILGTEMFLKKYEEILLEQLNRTKPNKWGNDGKAYNIRYGGNIQISKIYNFLYKDATVYLERKHNRFAVVRQVSQKS